MEQTQSIEDAAATLPRSTGAAGTDDRTTPSACCGHSLADIDASTHAVSICTCEHPSCMCLETDLDTVIVECCGRRARRANTVERGDAFCDWYEHVECAPASDARREQQRVEHELARQAATGGAR